MNEPDEKRGGTQPFTSHVALTLACRCLTVLSVGVAGILLARWLGPGGLGELATINVTVLVALQLGSLGLPAANTFFVARDSARLSGIFGNSLIFSVVAGAILAVAVWVLSHRAPWLFGNVSAELITVAAFSLPFQLFSLLGLNLLLGLRRILAFNFLDAAGQSILLVNALIAVVAWRRGLLTLVTFNTVTAALISIAVAWTIFRVASGRVNLDLPLFKTMASYGLKVQVSTLMALLIIRADLLIVNYFRGASEAGVYAVASQVASLLMLIPTVIGTLLMPRVASRFHEASDLTMRVTRHTTFLMLVICLVAVPATFLLPVFYGPAFGEATTQLLILLPGVFLVSVQSVLVQYFGGTGLPVAIPIFWSVCFAANLALNLTLVPTFGARAAALSSTISYALIFVMVTTLFRVQTAGKLSQTFMLKGPEFRELLTLARPSALWR